MKGSEAHSLGLVDAVVPANELIDAARRWAVDIAKRKKPWVSSLYKADKLEPLGEAREILKFARAQARKQAPNLKHPLVCIDVIEEGIVSGPRAGLWKVFWPSPLLTLIHALNKYALDTDKIHLLQYWQEAEAFDELLHSDTCKSLVHIFFAQRATSKVVFSFFFWFGPRHLYSAVIFFSFICFVMHG